MTNTAVETVTLTLTLAQVQTLEDELQHSAVFHLKTADGHGGNPGVTEALKSDYYRANRELFGLVYDANPANS